MQFPGQIFTLPVLRRGQCPVPATVAAINEIPQRTNNDKQ